ncbi:MAG: hypothetical protein IJN90_00620 [Bacilli bacterium]|nr:hypothetical protein [Bacilli bacterium]
MKDLDKRDMPTHLIVLALIFIFPLGIYYIVLKTEKYLKNIKRNVKYLKTCGYIGLFFVVMYFILNYDLYVSLIDSHMSLDMYSFKFIYIYLFVLMITISTLIGGSKLNKLCDKLVIYTEFINIRHIKEIKFICEETLEDEETVKENINKLIDLGYLVNIKLVDNHIVSTKTVDKDFIKCKSCGNIVKDKRCDFCYRKIKRKKEIKG